VHAKYFEFAKRLSRPRRPMLHVSHDHGLTVCPWCTMDKQITMHSFMVIFGIGMAGIGLYFLAQKSTSLEFRARTAAAALEALNKIPRPDEPERN